MPFFVWDRLFYFKFVYNINEFLSPYLYCGLDIRLEYNFKQVVPNFVGKVTNWLKTKRNLRKK